MRTGHDLCDLWYATMSDQQMNHRSLHIRDPAMFSLESRREASSSDREDYTWMRLFGAKRALYAAASQAMARLPYVRVSADTSSF